MCWGRVRRCHESSFARWISENLSCLPQHVSSSRVTRWVWEIIWAQVWFLIWGSWGQWAINCSISEWAGVIGSRWFSWSRTPRCFISVWGWLWDGGHAYWGSGVSGLRGLPHPAWAYSAGWLVLRVRAWHSAMLPCSSFLPWSSGGANIIVEGTLSARTQCTSSFIFTLSLVARAYTASGQAAFNLHAMAYLQVYRAKVLKDLHEGGPNLEMIQELHSVTDYALQAMKVMPHALWRGCPH